MLSILSLLSIYIVDQKN